MVNTLCRICAELKPDCRSIFESNERNIPLKMSRCLSITVGNEDWKPKEICESCYLKLDEFYEFIKLCQDSDKKFMCPSNTVIVTNEKTILDCSDLNQTVLRHSSEFKINFVKKKFTCRQCNKHFTRRNSLNIHVLTHSSKTFNCEICSKKLKNEQQLKRHKIIHSGKYKCEICIKSFSAPSKYLRHQKIHSQEKMFVCPVGGCGKSFVDKSNLKGHELTHSDVKLFICEICDKRYRTGSQVRDHMKVHDDLKCFGCGICGKKYKWKSNLLSHEKKHKV